MQTKKPLRCRNCRQAVDMSKLYVISGDVLVLVEPDKVNANCPFCRHPFQWEEKRRGVKAEAKKIIVEY